MLTTDETTAVQEYIKTRDTGAQFYRYQLGERACYGVGSKGDIVKAIIEDVNLSRLSQNEVTQLALDIVVNSAAAAATKPECAEVEHVDCN
jgi:hypothetical protein